MNPNGKGGDRKSSNAMLLDTLTDLGISKMQSHRWQTEAAVSGRNEPTLTTTSAAVHNAGVEPLGRLILNWLRN